MFLQHTAHGAAGGPNTRRAADAATLNAGPQLHVSHTHGPHSAIGESGSRLAPRSRIVRLRREEKGPEGATAAIDFWCF